MSKTTVRTHQECIKLHKRLNINVITFTERHSHAFPGHQPEIDNGRLKSVYNSWETTTRSSYVDPKIRQQPLQNPTS